MKRAVLAIFIAMSLSAIALVRIDGFFPSKIRGSHLEGIAEPIEAQYREILSQPFHYLAKGRQCFVFASEDGQTVIKFLNYNRFSFPRILLNFPWPHGWRKRLTSLQERRHRRFEATMNSFQLANGMLHEETGILYLHLQKGGDLPALQIQDRAHRRHRIDLNQTVFVLQKRATPIFVELANRWQVGGPKALEEGILAFTAFLQKRCLLQIADDDRDVEINFGFCDGQIMLLDPGRLYLDPALQENQRLKAEKAVASKRLRRWLMKHYPDSVAVLDAELTLF